MEKAWNGDWRLVGFVSTAKPAEARKFYEGTLGFRFVGDDEYALVFDANGTMLRVGKAQKHTAAPGTVVGWEVSDIAASVHALVQKGVVFNRYDFMQPDAAGIVTFQTGDKVAWFQDPDGNVLSLSQHAHPVAPS